MGFMMKKIIFFLLSLPAFLFFQTAFAATQLDPGDFQLEINGVLLDLEGTAIIDNIDFSGDTFTVKLSSNQSFIISSSERRQFSISPTTYTTRTCPASKSILQIQTPGDISQITYTISLGISGSCSQSDGGGGGGGGGGAAPGPAPGPVPSLTPPVPPPLGTVVPPPTLPLLETPPVEQPPTEIPPTIPPPASPIETPPTTVNQTIEAAQTIGSGAVSIGTSIGEGMLQIISGLATGQKGFGNIVRNFPNTGTYIWDTKQPFLSDPNAALKKLAEGNDYTILIFSSSLGQVRDISDSYFSFIQPKAVSFLKPKNSAYLLESLTLNVQAQENQESSIKLLSPNESEVWNIGGTYEIKWESKNLDASHLLGISLYKEHVFWGTEDALKIIKQMNKEVSEKVGQLRADKKVVSTVKNIAVPISVTITAASAGAITITATAGSASVAINLSGFFQALSFSRFYLLGFLRFKRRKPWGKIADKLSGKPISSATIQIYEAEFDKLKDSQLTDAEGRFSASVGIGKYYVTVSRKGYENFRSEIIAITSPEQILNLELYLLPLKEEFSLEYVKRINVWNAVKRFMELINPYLLAFGTLVSLITLAIIPNTLNYATLGIYILFDLLKIYFAFRLLKPLGKIIDEITGEPLPLAVVRIFEEDKNWLLATKVTDEQGQFNFLLAPGQYYLTCSKAGYDAFRSDTIAVKKDALPALNMKIKRAMNN